MSGATHRIEITHDPHNSTYPWDWAVYRTSDDQWLASGYNATQDAAIADARQWVKDEADMTVVGQTLYVTEDGLDADPPHSVKV